MSASLVLWLAGAVVLAGAVAMARAPLARYRGLQATEANLRRYDEWRGSRLVDDGARTGADEMKAQLRSRLRLWALVGVLGVGLVVAGFLVR